MKQRDLFEPLLTVLEEDGESGTGDVYERVRAAVGVDGNCYESVGVAKKRVNVFERKVRWAYQSLKHKGMVSSRRRGYWYITGTGKTHLTAIRDGCAMVAFRTDLGICLWGDATAAGEFDGRLSLICVSPPYPLLRPRSYGNMPADTYTEWLIEKLRPAVKLLRPGGSLVLNLGQDVYEAGKPVRSLYLEHTVLAMVKELGLRLHDRIPMINRTREPGPTEWALKRSFLMRQCWEPIYWFSNSDKPRSNNRAILKAYTKSLDRLVERGGESQTTHSPCGSRRRTGSYGSDNGGSVPGNILEVCHATPNNDPDYKAYAEGCRATGVPIHPARMPIEAVKTLIQFLTKPGEWVADPMAGSLTTCWAAELLDRRWLGVELMREFLQGGAHRFERSNGYCRDEEFVQACLVGQQGLF